MSTLGSAAIKAAAGAIAVPILAGMGKGLYDKLADAAGKETVSKAISIAKAGIERNKGGSLISYTQSARVEPILLMDQKAVYVPFIQDVVHTMSSLFTGYYLQAIALDTSLSGIKLVKRLDKFNPDRNLNDATTALLTSLEGYKYGLPFPGQAVGLEAYGIASPSFEADRPPKTFEEMLADARNSARVKEAIANEFPNREPSEAELLEKARSSARIRQAVEDEFTRTTSSVSTRDVGKMVTDISNLAVGQVIEVTITENGQSAKIPISIRLRVAGMPSEVLVETLAVGGMDLTTGSRFRQWRAGELRFWADLVMAQDRIAAHKKAVLHDKTGYYQAVTKRADKNLLVEVMSKGGPSVGTASSIIVMTEQTKLDLERAISGRLSHYKTREGIFANTFAMLMAVVDPDWETVVIYHRGIEMPTELTAKDVKKASGGQGPNVAEIMAAYQLGSAPSRL